MLLCRFPQLIGHLCQFSLQWNNFLEQNFWTLQVTWSEPEKVYGTQSCVPLSWMAVVALLYWLFVCHLYTMIGPENSQFYKKTFHCHTLNCISKICELVVVLLVSVLGEVINLPWLAKTSEFTIGIGLSKNGQRAFAERQRCNDAVVSLQNEFNRKLIFEVRWRWCVLCIDGSFTIGKYFNLELLANPFVKSVSGKDPVLLHHQPFYHILFFRTLAANLSSWTNLRKLCVVCHSIWAPVFWFHGVTRQDFA